MFFGEKSLFAIEVNNRISDDGKYNFANFCFWVENQSVGDYQEAVILNTLTYEFSQCVKSIGVRKDMCLYNKSIEILVDTIYDQVYETDNNTQTIVTNDVKLNKTYQDFVIFPWGPENFDRWFIVLIEGDKDERFVWTNRYEKDLKTMREVYLPKGLFGKISMEFLIWANQNAKEKL